MQHAKIQAQDDLYRRAQLRTPAENARRATWGGPLWVEYLTQELSKQSQQGIVWVSTTTRPTPKWMDDETTSKISIVSATVQYQAMWEQEAPESSSKHPMALLLERIRETIRKETTAIYTPLVIESLTPLVQVYGFPAVFYLVQQLVCTMPNSILLLPILSETFTPQQHQQLEDLAHTALWLSNHTGQVDLHVLRRGIREHDSTVREIWDFALQQSSSESVYSLMVGKEELLDTEENQQQEVPEQVNLLQAMNPALDPDAKRLSQQQQEQQPEPMASLTKQTKKITLKMEADEGLSFPNNPAPPTSNAPRIFLQDDDPEFEDYDEEDPDDDLDI